MKPCSKFAVQRHLPDRSPVSDEELYIDIRTDEAMENAGIRRVPLDDIKYII